MAEIHNKSRDLMSDKLLCFEFDVNPPVTHRSSWRSLKKILDITK